MSQPYESIIESWYLFFKKGEGYLVSACIMGFVYLFSTTTTFFGTKEMKGK